MVCHFSKRMVSHAKIVHSRESIVVAPKKSCHCEGPVEKMPNTKKLLGPVAIPQLWAVNCERNVAIASWWGFLISPQ